MAQIETCISVNCPQKKVFDFVTDLRNDEHWWDLVIHTEKITDGVVGVGTRFRQTSKVMIFTVHSEVEILEYNPPEYMRAVNHSPQLPYEVLYRFEETENGTTYTMLAQIEAQGLLRWVLPLTLKVLEGQVQRYFPDLKKYLEKNC